jgi:rRNA maturation RNase YbeY
MSVYVRVRLVRAKIYPTRIARLAERMLAVAHESGSELSIELIGDRRMHRLNRVYRKKDRPTDVLSFPMRDVRPGQRPAARGQGQEVRANLLRPLASRPAPELLGDIVISVPTARRQAQQAGHSVDEELAMLMIHGFLHLCGYDHERGEREARRMRRRERAMLRSLLPLPTLMSRARYG